MRYVYGITAAILIGGAAATLSNPVGAQTAQNQPGTIQAAPAARRADKLRPAGRAPAAGGGQHLHPPVDHGAPAAAAARLRGFLPPLRRRGAQSGPGRQMAAPSPSAAARSAPASSSRRTAMSSPTTTSSRRPGRTRWSSRSPSRCRTAPNMRRRSSAATQLADIAVLKVNPRGPLPFVRFGDSTRARVGDWVVAIGNPFGLGGTVTAGIISAVHRNIRAAASTTATSRPTPRSIRAIRAARCSISTAMSIGINTALISPTGGNVGIGFAIPAEQVAPVVEQLRRGQRVQRGYIGVGMQDVDEGVAAALGIERNRGTLIRSVTPGGPADRAGIQQGDVVVTVAGQPVNAGPDACLSDLAAADRGARSGRGDSPGSAAQRLRSPSPRGHRRTNWPASTASRTTMRTTMAAAATAASRRCRPSRPVSDPSGPALAWRWSR